MKDDGIFLQPSCSDGNLYELHSLHGPAAFQRGSLVATEHKASNDLPSLAELGNESRGSFSSAPRMMSDSGGWDFPPSVSRNRECFRIPRGLQRSHFAHTWKRLPNLISCRIMLWPDVSSCKCFMLQPFRSGVVYHPIRQVPWTLQIASWVTSISTYLDRGRACDDTGWHVCLPLRIWNFSVGIRMIPIAVFWNPCPAARCAAPFYVCLLK